MERGTIHALLGAVIRWSPEDAYPLLHCGRERRATDRPDDSPHHRVDLAGEVQAEELATDALIGADGIGLDSVEIAELLLAAEDACGIDAGEGLFEISPLTIAHVADHLALVAT